MSKTDGNEVESKVKEYMLGSYLASNRFNVVTNKLTKTKLKRNEMLEIRDCLGVMLLLSKRTGDMTHMKGHHPRKKDSRCKDRHRGM